MKKRILTGDRPTGKLHIGHYFGSLKNRVKLQNEYDTFIMIADVQALTDNFNNPQKVSKSIRELAKDYLSIGINPQKTTILVQSMIPQIAELTIFYSNLVTISRLQRNPTVKAEIAQKKELFKESVTYGFLGYPVSQAADITAFQADLVPVGEDQLPMIEQTREIVRKFNSIYGKVLIEPNAKVGDFPRVKGLDGNEKMGKSLNNAVYLSDSSEEVTNKIMNAKTDPKKIHLDSKGNPEACMVYYYHDLFTNKKSEVKEIKKECKKGERGCVQCKKELIKKVNDFLEPIREKRNYYEERPKEVDEILIEGTKKAKNIARETLEKVKEKMYLNYFK